MDPIHTEKKTASKKFLRNVAKHISANPIDFWRKDLKNTKDTQRGEVGKYGVAKHSRSKHEATKY